MISPSHSWQMDWMGLHGALMRARQDAGLSQQDVADRLGVDRRTVLRWENGLCDPSSKDLYRWAAALGLAFTVAPVGARDTSVTAEPDAVEPEVSAMPQSRPTARRRLPFVRPIRRSTALSTTEQARAYHLLVAEGRSHSAVAAILTAERPYGAAVCTEDEVSAHYRAERSLHFRDRFHGLPRVSLDGENATDRRSVHGKTARSPSRTAAGR